MPLLEAESRLTSSTCSNTCSKDRVRHGNGGVFLKKPVPVDGLFSFPPSFHRGRILTQHRSAAFTPHQLARACRRKIISTLSPTRASKRPEGRAPKIDCCRRVPSAQKSFCARSAGLCPAARRKPNRQRNATTPLQPLKIEASIKQP